MVPLMVYRFKKVSFVSGWLQAQHGLQRPLEVFRMLLRPNESNDFDTFRPEIFGNVLNRVSNLLPHIRAIGALNIVSAFFRPCNQVCGLKC